MKLLIISLILLVLLIAGCTGNVDSQPVNPAVNVCVSLCNSVKSKQDLSNGPCLSDNNPDWTISDWVCDVAHSPRQSVDNLPENQCSDFREGKAKHFVEVDTSCNLITVY